jgi:hypothetical protein
MVIHVSCMMTKGQTFQYVRTINGKSGEAQRHPLLRVFLSNLHTEISLGGFQLHQGLFLDPTVIIEFLGEGSPVCRVLDVVEQ